MIRRVLAAAFPVLLMLPAAGSAQLMPLQDDPTSTPRIRIAPFVGYLTAVQRTDEWTSANGAELLDVDFELGDGPAVGVAAAMALYRSLGVTAAGGYGRRDASIFTPAGSSALRLEGGNDVFFGRLGANLSLHEPQRDLQARRISASVFAGGIVMHERPTDSLMSNLIGNATHFGVNLGIEGELPFASDRFALQLAVEDNILWFDETQMGNLAFAYFDDGSGTFTRAQTRASTELSQAWLLRAGISIRLR